MKFKIEGNDMKKKNILLIGILLIMALLFVACAKQPLEEQKVETELEEEVEVEDEAEPEPEESEVEIEDASSEEESEEAAPQIDWSTAVSVWTTDELNLRAEPNTDCDIITVLAKGTELKKASEEDDWAYIQCGDYEGYVSTKYLADEKPKEEAKEEKPSVQKVEAIHPLCSNHR